MDGPVSKGPVETRIEACGVKMNMNKACDVKVNMNEMLFLVPWMSAL